MHVAAINPRFVRESEVDPETVENEKRVLTEQALESGKPREIVEKMIVGRLKKWKKEICLLDQPFVKNGDLTVAQELKRVGGDIGVSLDVVGFTRFVRGEGIEKQESNLAEEVAALSK
jgi:elongation factor Ts